MEILALSALNDLILFSTMPVCFFPAIAITKVRQLVISSGKVVVKLTFPSALVLSFGCQKAASLKLRRSVLAANGTASSGAALSFAAAFLVVITITPLAPREP